MDMIKFAVWGIGVRGKNAVRDLGNMVVCIIESNTKYHNTNYKNIPIVSYDEYMVLYSKYPVIITPFDHAVDIKQMLLEKGINNTFIYWDCQDLIRAFAVKIPVDNFIKNFNKNNRIMIYTRDILGCLFYNYLSENELLEVAEIIPDNLLEECDLIKVKILYKEYYKAIMLNLSDFYYNPQIEQFKDIHQGKRCFIVATGPSLRMEDLDILHKNKEICFSMNGIFAAFDHTKWRPDYYVVADLKVVQQWKKKIFGESIKAKFIAVGAELQPAQRDTLQNENIYKWYEFREYANEGTLHFSEDFARGTSNGWTVTYTILQLAVYMGFSEIYLLGVNCNYTKGVENNYFYEEEEKDMMDRNEEGMVLAYQAAEKYAKSHGVKICNATRGGMLEVFERVDFDSLFQKG